MVLNFNSYLLLNEESVGKDHTSGDPDAAWFIILLGGSGTGKGALVSTDKALGEIGDYIDGKTFSSDTLRKKIAAGEEHIRSVFEPDRILRLVQYDVAVDDYNKIVTTDPEKKLDDTLKAVLGDALSELKDYLLDRCGKNARVKDFIREYPNNGKTGSDYSNDYVGKKYRSTDDVESIEIEDALVMPKLAGGDSSVCTLYQQMRNRQTGVTGGISIKEYAVNLANDLVKDHLTEFSKVFKGKKTPQVKMGSVILDSAGEDIAKQPVRDQLMAAKGAGFNTMIVILANGPAQSFVGNVSRKIAGAKRAVPAEEIMPFYNALPEKHKEFVKYGEVDQDLGYALLDGYKIIEQDSILPDELDDILRAICIGDVENKKYGPAKMDKVICNDPDGNCVVGDVYPDYLTQDLQDVVDTVNKDSSKRRSHQKIARNWDEVYDNPEDKKKDVLVVVQKLSMATKKNNAQDKLPLDCIDGFSKEANDLFIEWERVVKGGRVAESDNNTKYYMKERRVMSFMGYVSLNEKFGKESFFLSKNGDASNYFFKIDGEKDERGFVLTVNKTHTVGSHEGSNNNEFCVLHLVEITPDELDQAVIDKGKFTANKNNIDAKESELVRILSSVADCMRDYLEQNSSVEKIYDEMLLTLKVQNYEEKMQVSFDKWPGSNWNIQEVETGKLNLITK